MIAQELEVSLHMAFVEARQQRHEFITVEHLLLALLRQSEGVVPQVVAKIGTRPESLVAQVEQQLSSKPKVYGANQQVGLSRPAH